MDDEIKNKIRTFTDKYQFYSIAQGSLTELQNQIIIAHDVGYLEKDKFEKINEQTIIVNKLINGLKRIKYKIQNTNY